MRLATVTFIVAAALAIIGPAQAQSPPVAPAAENLAAARELLDITKPTEQFRAILPTLFQSMKAAIVQNRPEVEKQYDAMTPLFYQSAQKRLNELTDIIAGIYATNFTVDELHGIAAFLRTPIGQKFISRQTAIAQQSIAAGQQFGQLVAKDVQQQMSSHAN